MSMAHAENTPHPSARLHETLAGALLLAALSDRLLYMAPAGLSLALVALAAGGGALWLHRTLAGNQRRLSAAATYVLAALPLLENVSLLSVLVCATLCALASLALADGLRGALSSNLRQLAWFALALPVTAPVGLLRWRSAQAPSGKAAPTLARAGVWLMPAGLGLVFLALFQEANPIIAGWLARFDFWALITLIDPLRLAFAALAFTAGWAYLRPAVRPVSAAPVAAHMQAAASSGLSGGASPTIGDILFGEAAIFRSLLVFNLLFLVQTLLDLAYLPGGASLPDGLSHAAYAHRGAYPLIATALLAAVFVLLALREASPARANPLIRKLVYLWIGQNIALTGSSVFRLGLYVAEYGLTYWRVAAFVWMGLVACGLAFIVWRLAAGKSASWLIGANILATSLALYLSCFVNFAGIIANYNMAHGHQDYWYVTGLGPEAIAAIDTAIATGQTSGAEVFLGDRGGFLEEGESGTVAAWRVKAAARFADDFADWRGFTLRKWRLSRYLAAHPLAFVRIHGRLPENR